MENAIVNRVAQSSIVTLNLEDYLPKEEVVIFDLKDFLYMGLIIKEKDYRDALETNNREIYSNKNVTISCTADAIIPMWAYMLAAQYLQSFAKSIHFGTIESATNSILISNIKSINTIEFVDKRVVVKGCGEVPIPAEAYVTITALLKPHVKSVMYGEPCSTVPIFKKGKV